MKTTPLLSGYKKMCLDEKEKATLNITLRLLFWKCFPLATVEWMEELDNIFYNDEEWRQIWLNFKVDIEHNVVGGFNEIRICKYEDYHRVTSNQVGNVLNRHEKEIINFIRQRISWSTFIYIKYFK